MTDHTHETTAHKGDPSLDRLLFFSDGVFAIAITLLSIELHVPHGWDGTFDGLFAASWPMFGSFFISFAVIGVLWNAHRRCFLKMVRFTNGVFLFNLIVLAGIALMPFATQLLWVRGPTDQSVLIYLALVSVIGLAQGLTYGYAAFVANAIRPVQPWPLRLSAFLMQALMPSVCSSLALLTIGTIQSSVPVWLPILITAVLFGLVFFRIGMAKRYAQAA